MNRRFPPGSDAEINMIEQVTQRLRYQNYQVLKFFESYPLFYNLFSQRYKSQLNNGTKSKEEIIKMAIEHTLKHIKSNGGRTKRRHRKHRRTLKRK